MLKIKDHNVEGMDEISLERNGHTVRVIINGEQVASFDDDGRFRYYGMGIIELFAGRWNP